MKNNLFYYATSELSQDAFICWLMSFALDSSPDPVLKKCAIQLIKLFVPELSSVDFTLTKIEHQVALSKKNRLDVLLTVEAVGQIYKIIVEDKTYTSEGDNQLQRYVDEATVKFPGCAIRGVYYKTGFQCDHSAAKNAGYTIINRKQLVTFMRDFAPLTTNQIFLDYYNYWSTYQNDTELFQNLPLTQWGYMQVYGFYDHLKESAFFDDKGFWFDYGYVPNQNNGFYGLWAGSDLYSITINGKVYELYLQLETATGDLTTSQICLKLSAQDKKTDRDHLRATRDHLVYTHDWTYKLNEFHFHKPKRLAMGRHMTIGVYDASLTDFNDFMKALQLAVQDYNKFLLTLHGTISK